jgi:hypothetical protein
MTANCHVRSKWIISLFLIAVLSNGGYVEAIEINQGDLTGSWDTNISFGTLHRVQPMASDLHSRASGGAAYSANGDDGNLNYKDTGLVSSTLKFTTELELNYKNFGVFVRGTGFQDSKANGITGDTQRTPLSDTTIRLNGENLSLLDAYVWGDFKIGSMPFSLRVGEQVVSWGESTFIQNSINVINPVDVSKLRVPGAQLKEALTPVGIVFASLGIFDDVSLEAYWQYDYERTLIDPTGSYFSTNDFVGAGGTFVALGFGACPDYLTLGGTLTSLPNFPAAICGAAPGTAFSAGRADDVRPDQGEEYGVALRIYSEALNDSEFGFYHIKYHSRLPVINAIADTPGATFPVNNPALPASYFISYPEDIHLFGASFNTQLGTSGIALQGEYSYRNDVPLQVDDVELLAAALHFELLPGGGATSQLGVFANGATIPGFIERDVSQFQMTASKVFGNVFKANQAVMLSEFAITHIHDMPSQSDLRLEAAGTNLPGNPITAGFFTVPVETNDYADSTSWGYRFVGRLTYNNVIGAVNLSPRIGWRHDVSGNTPGPGGNFIEGFKQMTLGVTADYQNSWRADLSYTGFYGAGSQNLLQDRDFVAFSLSYAF